MNIGQIIRSRRKQKGLTQEQLGKAIGVSKMAISKYERNIVDNMGREKILALSKLLDIPIENFLDTLDENNKNFSKMTPLEFYNKVEIMLEDTSVLTDEQKEHILSTLKFICGIK